MTSICPTREKRTAKQNGRLVKRPSWNTDLVRERDERALNMSKKTKQVNVIVVSLLVIFPSSIISLNT